MKRDENLEKTMLSIRFHSHILVPPLDTNLSIFAQRSTARNLLSFLPSNRMKGVYYLYGVCRHISGGVSDCSVRVLIPSEDIVTGQVCGIRQTTPSPPP